MTKEGKMRRPLQGIFVLGGIALIIAGTVNGSRPLMIVGAALIGLALSSRFMNRLSPND